MRRLVLIALLLPVAFVAIAVTIAARGSGSRDAYRGSIIRGDHRLPAFTLEEWNGARVDSRRLRGKVVLVTFLETKCTQACPLIADHIDLGLARLRASERRDVYAIAISTHPGDDTRESVRRFLRKHGVLGELHYLRGPESRLRPVWRAFHVASALDSGDASAHSAPVRIFDRSGRWVTTLHPHADLTPANLAHDIRLALGTG